MAAKCRFPENKIFSCRSHLIFLFHDRRKQRGEPGDEGYQQQHDNQGQHQFFTLLEELRDLNVAKVAALIHDSTEGWCQCTNGKVQNTDNTKVDRVNIQLHGNRV